MPSYMTSSGTWSASDSIITIFLCVAAMVVVMRLVSLLGRGGVEEELLTVPAEDDAGDGAVERDIGDGHGGGGADHRGDLGGAVTVNGEHFAGDDNVVAQVGREERAHRAVDETAREHGVQSTDGPRGG